MGKGRETGETGLGVSRQSSARLAWIPVTGTLSTGAAHLSGPQSLTGLSFGGLLCHRPKASLLGIMETK